MATPAAFAIMSADSARNWPELPIAWRHTTTPASVDEPASTRISSVSSANFVFRIWSGARDLNPEPHGPESVANPSRSACSERFQFESPEAGVRPVRIRGNLSLGLLHGALHESSIPLTRSASPDEFSTSLTSAAARTLWPQQSQAAGAIRPLLSMRMSRHRSRSPESPPAAPWGFGRP